MPDARRHRGPHPHDQELFASETHAALREAVGHLSWLRTRGYAEPSALKLVGDRFSLTERQRRAVARCGCSDQQLARRCGTQVPLVGWAGETVEIDGFNVLTTIEAALAGGVVLLARDGCYRDMASMHGSYRKVDETRPALTLIGECLARHGVAACVWRLDRPVSNSGRLQTILIELAQSHGWDWSVSLDADPDPLLCRTGRLVASADSMILDACGRWCNLARTVVEEAVPAANVVRLNATAETG
jgi:hypothetical protein